MKAFPAQAAVDSTYRLQYRRVAHDAGAVARHLRHAALVVREDPLRNSWRALQITGRSGNCYHLRPDGDHPIPSLLRLAQLHCERLTHVPPQQLHRGAAPIGELNSVSKRELAHLRHGLQSITHTTKRMSGPGSEFGAMCDP